MFLMDIDRLYWEKKQIIYLSRDHKHFLFCLLKSRCDNETGGGNINPPKASRVFSQEVSNDCHWICCSACYYNVVQGVAGVLPVISLATGCSKEPQIEAVNPTPDFRLRAVCTSNAHRARKSTSYRGRVLKRACIPSLNILQPEMGEWQPDLCTSYEQIME